MAKPAQSQQGPQVVKNARTITTVNRRGYLIEMEVDGDGAFISDPEAEKVTSDTGGPVLRGEQAHAYIRSMIEQSKQ